MEFLFEEVFRKMYSVINGMSFPHRVLIKLVFDIIIVLLLSFLVWLIYKNYYSIILLIFVLFFIAETAHYIRKSRLKMVKEEIKEKDKKTFNKGLLTEKKPKNKNLLKASKPKNKELLRKKPKTVAVKTSLDKVLIEKKRKKAKNKNLLKTSKIKK